LRCALDFLPKVGKKYERHGPWCAATVSLTVSISGQDAI
jgi:hypothetical protein